MRRTRLSMRDRELRMSKRESDRKRSALLMNLSRKLRKSMKLSKKESAKHTWPNRKF